MQSENKMFDDLRQDGERLCRDHGRNGPRGRILEREKMREWIGGVDFVGRDEFEAVKAMAAAARDENEALKAPHRRARSARSPARRGTAKRPRQAPSREPQS